MKNNFLSFSTFIYSYNFKIHSNSKIFFPYKFSEMCDVCNGLLKLGSHVSVSISIRTKQKLKQRNEVKPAT